MFKVVFATDLRVLFASFQVRGCHCRYFSPSQPPTLGISTIIIISKTESYMYEDFAKPVRNSSPAYTGVFLLTQDKPT
jgi:hypothetical protein